MKVLFITPLFPYPLESGGQIRFFNLIKRLSKKHKITLFSFIRKEREKEFIAQLAPYCEKIRVFKRRWVWSPFNFLLAGFSRLPFLSASYWSWEFKKAVEKELLKGYDLVHLECFYTGASLPKISIPLVLVEHNLEWEVYSQFARQFKIFFLRPFLFFDIWKMRKWEIGFWKKAEKVVAVSKSDQGKIEKILGKKCELVLNGVDCAFFAQIKRKPVFPPRVLFVGNMKWFPNRDAVFFLLKEIWPKIKKKIPKAKLWIVGRNFPKEFCQLEEEGVEFERGIEDIRRAYALASILIVPLRMGGGIKFKVLEAMASGLPVVSTKIGVEGIGVEEGKEYFGGEKAEELAEKTVLLLKNKDLREKIGKAGQSFIRKYFDWGKIVEKLDEVYREVKKLRN